MVNNSILMIATKFENISHLGLTFTTLTLMTLNLWITPHLSNLAEPNTTILGNKELFIEAGSTINLGCMMQLRLMVLPVSMNNSLLPKIFVLGSAKLEINDLEFIYFTRIKLQFCYNLFHVLEFMNNPSSF